MIQNQLQALHGCGYMCTYVLALQWGEIDLEDS